MKTTQKHIFLVKSFLVVWLLSLATALSAQITINEQQKPIRQVLKSIEKAGGVNFFYSDEFDALNKIVSIKTNNSTIEQVLKQLFADTSISWEKKDKNLIVLTPGKLPAQNRPKSSRIITGTVLDDKGNVIIGATILEKGTSNGTITNYDGQFQIELPANTSDQLLISYVGMKPAEVNASGKNTLQVVLSEQTLELSDVVVVGYGVQRRSDLTGAVSSVKVTEALKHQPSTDVAATLQGGLAGVSVVSGSGDPSKEMTIRIRGVNSISSDSQPLVVIDGFMGGSLKSLNPSDIESIEVLKDASATAVYGSQGANGVILVTTKNPQKDKISLAFNSFASFQTIYNYPDVLSPGEFARLANDYGREYFPTMPNPQPAKTYFTEEQIRDFDQGKGGYDYVRSIFNDPAISQNYDLSLSGGNAKTSFLASLRYAGSQGVLKKSAHDAVNYRLKVDNTLRDWLKVGMNMYGDYSNSRGPRVASYEGILQTAINWPTTSSPYKADGSQNNLFPIGGLAAYNPVGYINDVNNVTQTMTNNLQVYADFKITKDLSFRSQFGVRFSESLAQHSYDSESYFYFKNNRTQANATTNWDLSWLNTNILNYTKDFNEDHRINATAVLEQSYMNNYLHRSTAEMLAFDLGFDALDWADKYYVSSMRTISTMLSGMVRLNYVFKNRYMLTASYRADGSSRLYHKWDDFPSFALAWDLAQEDFMKNISAISQFKLRAGYGVVGNQAIAPYSIYSQMVPVSNSDGTTSYVVGRPASPELRWERNEQLNAGIDLAFWSGRLTLSADVYNKVSRDILLNVAQPVHTGWSSLLKNAGEITNKGIEITIGGTPLTQGELRWNTNLTLAHNKAIYSLIPTLNKMQAMDSNVASSPMSIFQMIEGREIASFYGYTSNGVWKTTEVNETTTVNNADGTTKTDTYANIYKVVPGQLKIVDLNTDGKIDVNDKSVIGSGQPSFNWGWNNTYTWKNFDLNIFMVGFHGFDIYNATNQSGFPNSINGVAQDVLTPKRDFLNRWTKDNEDTDVPGFVYVSSPVQGFMSKFVEKGDFVKIKNMTLGYNLPAAASKKAGLENLRVYLSVQNPLMLTSYKGLDPEATLGNPLTSGVDWGNYPNGRNFIAGFSFTF